MIWTLYDTYLGTFHSLTDDEAEDVKEFYSLFLNKQGQWENGRFYLWKEGE